MSYSAYREICPPSSVDHSVYARFTGNNNLIITKANILTIYLVQEKRLKFHSEYRLHGIVQSMGVIRNPKLDYILLAFNDAKMSLLEFSETLSTISIHHFEKEEFKKQLHARLSSPTIRTDPQGRCAVLSFFTNFFSILPFTQDYAEIDNSKSPYLPSFVLLHSEIDPVVKNVIDFVFLHGYLQPTLAILFQSKQTCAGRLGVLKDSVSVVVVSIDVTQKKYPLLYRVDELPYNSNRIIAVPKPLGGLLILGHNSLIYIDQTSNPGLCCILNGYFDGETELKSSTAVVDAAELLPLKPKPPSKFVKLGKVCDYRNLGIALDGASCIFLTPDILLLILRDGEMFQVDLIGDDGIGRSWKRRRGGVKKIEISKIGLRTIKASCLVSIHDFAGNLTANSHTWTDESGSTYVSSYFFIGSKVNDCLLVEYSECLEQSKSVASGQQTADFDDDLDLDLYGNSNFPIQENATFYKKTMIKYRVCDSLMVVGPMRDIAIGKIAYYSSHNFQSDGSPGYDLEVVACTGDGYDGSLTALHNSLRPKILSSFELKDVQDIWSISSSNFHKYVFLSRTNGTAILKTGDEFEEIEKEFYRDGPTIYASAIHNDFIVQVYKNDGSLVQKFAHYPSIVSASIAESYVLLKTDLDITVLKLNSDDSRLIQIYKSASLDITSAYLFFDISGSTFVYSDEIEVEDADDAADQDTKVPLPHSKKPSDFDEYDEDDLYGEDTEMEDPNAPAAVPKSQTSKSDQVKKECEPRIWCLILTNVGSFKILSLDTMRIAFEYSNLHTNPISFFDQAVYQSSETRITDIEEICLSLLDGTAYLFVRNSKLDLAIYETEIDYSRKDQDEINNRRLGLRFKRISHSHVSRDHVSFSDTDGDKMHPLNQQNSSSRYTLFKPFDCIGSRSGVMYSGVVMCGPRPCWIMMATNIESEMPFLANIDKSVPNELLLDSLYRKGSGRIRVHPMHVDGGLRSFAPLHNINSPYGFVYINNSGLFRVSQLLPQFNYDYDWAICKVPLGRSAQKVVYHVNSQKHILLTSNDKPFSLEVARYAAAIAAGVIINGDDLPDGEKRPNIDFNECLDGKYFAKIQSYQMQLISPVTWESVDIVNLLDNEQVLSVKSAELLSSETTSGRKEYIVLATAYLRSEDLPCRGRILVYDIIDVVPEPGKPQTNNKFKLFCKKDEKAPVTAICAVNGCLLAAVGNKIIMHAVEEGELNGIAFLDINIFVTNISSVKNLILISDVYKSVWFVAFQEDPPKLIPLGKDHYPVQVYGSEFLLDENTLSMIVTDSLCNLVVLSYAPFSLQSQGGQRLIRRGEMHTGHHIHSFVPIRFCATLVQGLWQQTNRYAAIAGTLEGGLSLVVPVTEKMFKRLYSLYSRMVTHVEHHAGLNPRGFRQLYLPYHLLAATTAVSGPPGPKGILDGDLTNEFKSLPSDKQYELAKAIGSKPDRILDDLLDLEVILEYF